MRKNKNRIAKLNHTCERCGYVSDISIDKDSKDDIKICCPNCGFRNRQLENDLQMIKDIHMSKIDELVFILKSTFITQPMLKMQIIKLKTAIFMIKFGRLLKSIF